MAFVESLARILCLFHAHHWGRLTVFTLDGRKRLYENCDRCGVMRPAVIS